MLNARGADAGRRRIDGSGSGHGVAAADSRGTRPEIASEAERGRAGAQANLLSLLPRDLWLEAILPHVEFGDYQTEPQAALGRFDLASMRAEATEVLRRPLPAAAAGTAAGVQ